jgi:glycosyltransferase involved in cell wall biosynthesis
MRIGVIAPPWVPIPPPAYGGTEVVVDTLTTGLLKAGHDVRLFASGDSSTDVPLEWVIPVAPGIDTGGSAVEFHHVKSAYDAFSDCDVIHDHTVLGPLYGARNARRPVVTTNHNPFALPFSAILADVAASVPIIAISHHHARSAAPIPIAAVIHHGVEPSKFPIGDGGGGYVLFLGRMSEGKGAHRALRIAREAGVELVLAGKMHTDAEHEYFDTHVAPHLGKGATYVGEVDAVTKVELLTKAACVLNPIAWPEPFGMVMIESLACGTPVLALASGAAPEIIEHGVTGFLADSEDELVRHLAELDSIERVACRARVEAQFSAGRMVRDHVQLYEQLIAADQTARVTS